MAYYIITGNTFSLWKFAYGKAIAVYDWISILHNLSVLARPQSGGGLTLIFCTIQFVNRSSLSIIPVNAFI